MLIALGLLCIPSGSRAAESGTRVFQVKPMPVLEAGIVIGRHQEFGYSNLVTIVDSDLTDGAVESLPSSARDYTRMFHFAVLANVVREEQGEKKPFQLEKVGIGFAMEINSQMVVVNAAKAEDLGADLGMIGKGVLRGNEDCLPEIVEVARTNRLVIFDAEANMLIGKLHEKRIIRHLIWVTPENGKLGLLVWQLKDLDTETKATDFQLDLPTMNIVRVGVAEKRRIHVTKGGFLGMFPKPEQFALVSLPPGEVIEVPEKMRAVAGKRTFTLEDLQLLVDGVKEVIAARKMAQQNAGQTSR